MHKTVSFDFSVAGVDALLMTFTSNAADDLPLLLTQLRQQILTNLSDVVVDVVPAYSTLLVYYDARTVRLYDLQLALEHLVSEIEQTRLPQAQPLLLEVPVVYGGEHGPDLERVAALNKLTPDQVIEKHLAADYVVAALGFSPGFAYLSGLDEQLVTPRLDTPRKQVPAGSVGIAGVQTAVYPTAGPGGWNLIGKAQMRWFNVNGNIQLAHGPDAMTPVQVGDKVRFIRQGDTT
ncbi:allophanate hydrolase [Aliidiomarina taiwanensis]|uniref:Allophanate hydrolase n=1 Tax=Aliidiomarina taiwanensis TaxID=946228 RepID=A0A432XAA1_9GAMM|nr:5-oxoprolinase subunit PxpB [Aliidiomarina taiwanensis]RUO44338.1 allophanate hydrolase [Aliidiomarina taiwanensis]